VRMPNRNAERMPFFYHLAVRCTRTLLNVFAHWTLVGLDRVPRQGPLLVVSNHQSNADPPILVGVLPRVVHCMAKQEIFDSPAAPLAAWYGAFPVRRGQADRQAVRTALEFLERGSCVAMFPEGTRSPSGALIKAQTGAGLIAIRSAAPILPVAIIGTEQLRRPWAVLRRPRIDIIIGEPFQVPPHRGSGRAAAAALATEAIMRRIASLLPPSLRGYYSEPDPLPVQAARAPG
jgi:1-acyl-sn-glycerol-3-phosphate acyltransferase